MQRFRDALLMQIYGAAFCANSWTGRVLGCWPLAGLVNAISPVVGMIYWRRIANLMGEGK